MGMVSKKIVLCIVVLFVSLPLQAMLARPFSRNSMQLYQRMAPQRIAAACKRYYSTPSVHCNVVGELEQVKKELAQTQQELREYKKEFKKDQDKQNASIVLSGIGIIFMVLGMK